MEDFDPAAADDHDLNDDEDEQDDPDPLADTPGQAALPTTKGSVSGVHLLSAVSAMDAFPASKRRRSV